MPQYEPIWQPAHLSSDVYDSLNSFSALKLPLPQEEDHPGVQAAKSISLDKCQFVLTRTKYYSKLSPYYLFVRKHLPGPYLLKQGDSSPIKINRTLDELPEDIQSDLAPFVSFPKYLGPGMVTTDESGSRISSESLAKPNHTALNELLLSTMFAPESVGRTYSDHALFLSAVFERPKKGRLLIHLMCSRPEELRPFISVNSLASYLSRATDFKMFSRDPRPLHLQRPLPTTVRDFLSKNTSPTFEHQRLLKRDS